MGSAMDSAIQDASKAIDTSAIGANTTAGLQAGMSLAQRQQDIEAKRQAIQFQQDQHQIQKSDWMHEQQKNIALASTKEDAQALIDQYVQEAPGVTGQRIEPTQEKYLRSIAGKVTPYSQAMIAAATMNDLVKNPALYMGKGADEAHKTALAFAQQSLDHMGMNARDAINNSKQVQQQTAQLQIAVQNNAAKNKIVTPEVAAAAGMSQEDAQDQADASNPFMARNKRMLDDQASKAGSVYDSGLKKIFSQKQALDRSLHTLSDPSTPITPQIFKEAEKEFVTALTGSGATGLGQTEKTEYNDTNLQIAEFMQKRGNKMVDLRKEAPELVNQLVSSSNRLSEAYSNNMEDTASKIDKNFTQSDNPKVHEIRKLKLADYAPKYFKQAFPNHVSPTASNAMAGQSTSTPSSDSGDEAYENQAKQASMQAIDAIKKAGGTLNGKNEEDIRKKYKEHFGKDL